MRKKSTSAGGESQSSGRQVAYQRGNPRDGSPHYIFLYPEDDQSEDEEHFSLKPRNPGVLPRKIEVINVQVQSEDTLQALALRYQCTISELKRINNIHKDNEIHAHRLIKVPVQPFSLLTETIEATNETNKLVVFDDEAEQNKLKEESAEASKPKSSSSTVEINNIILNSTIEPLFQFNNNESSEVLENTETDNLINPSENNYPSSNNYVVSTFSCSGADWGLSWFQLICFFLLLGFAGPIIYVLYIAESSNKHHDFSEPTNFSVHRSEKL